MEDEEMAGYGDLINGLQFTSNTANTGIYNYTGNAAYSNYTIGARLQCVKVIWTPKEDITTYELAKASPLMIASCHGSELIFYDRFGEMIKDMGSKTLRHFDIEDPNFEGVEWDDVK
jgi:hypothetical protein